MVSAARYLMEGPRMVLTSCRNRFMPQKYFSTAKDICELVVKNCWNGTYFVVSPNNFKQFWTRDFGWCTKSLLRLGYEKEVYATLRYALNRFKKYNTITTTINFGGKPYNFPTPAADSLPWLIHSIKISKFPYHEYRDFLNKEIKKYFESLINKQTGLIEPELHLSSIKDYALRKSSCYDNCMAALLAKDLPDMKLINPFESFDYEDLLKRHFWNGHYFYDDLRKKSYVAGDANLFPFALGIINDKEMLRSAIEEIKTAGLDQPFPLKYTASREEVLFIPQEKVVYNYESDSIWTHMGPLYIKILQQVDKEAAIGHKQKYTEWIEKHHNYLEVFFADERPFRSPFYYCDMGMLWAANYLTL